jgi:hypothetical protein
MFLVLPSFVLSLVLHFLSLDVDRPAGDGQRNVPSHRPLTQ